MPDAVATLGGSEVRETRTEEGPERVDRSRRLQTEGLARAAARGPWGRLPGPPSCSRTAERLDEVCDVDLDAIDVELPRGFGRD